MQLGKAQEGAKDSGNGTERQFTFSWQSIAAYLCNKRKQQRQMRPPQQAQLPLKEEMEIWRPSYYCHHQPRVQNGHSFNMLNIAPVL
jgi:hypothetical protein